jgi:hypothetical protein
MQARKLVNISFFILVCLIAGPYACYKISYPTYSFRYRLTLEVESEGAIRSGSSVIEVRLIKQPQFIIPVPPFVPEASGEAVFADLGKGRSVIALLVSNGDTNIDYPKYVVPFHLDLTKRGRDQIIFEERRTKWELAWNRLPTFMTFGDLSDPTTGRQINTAEFETVLGPDVHFRRILVETTDEPITHEIEKRFPWWNQKLPWIETAPAGWSYDTRRAGFRWDKGMFQRTR